MSFCFYALFFDYGVAQKYRDCREQLVIMKSVNWVGLLDLGNRSLLILPDWWTSSYLNLELHYAYGQQNAFQLCLLGMTTGAQLSGTGENEAFDGGREEGMVVRKQGITMGCIPGRRITSYELIETLVSFLPSLWHVGRLGKNLSHPTPHSMQNFVV